MRRGMMWTLGAALLLAVGSLRAAETQYVFPEDSGVVDVSKAPYLAKGDGQTDDTAAIQKALDDNPATNAIIYLPNGTYLVSATLKWPHGAKLGQEERRTILQGQSRTETIIRLRDGAAKGQANPMPLLWTGAGPQHYRNAVRALTLDVGKNPNAIGAQFAAANQGTFREVTIRCDGGAAGGDGSEMAQIGLDLSYADELGPMLIKDVSVEGFRVGIKCGHATNSMTFVNLRLNSQTETGLENDGQCVSINGLIARNVRRPIVNHGATSLMVLTDARMTGAKEGEFETAVVNEGRLLARDLDVPAYKTAITNKRAEGAVEKIAGPRVEEWTSEAVLGEAKGKTLELTVKAAPEVEWAEQKEWVSPLAFGAEPGTGLQRNNASDALQKALDSGKSTVYLPHGSWYLDADVAVPATVQRLIGCEARVWGPGRVVVGAGEAGTEPLIIERIDGAYNGLKIHHDSQRPLVISSCMATYTAIEAAGDLYLEDVSGPTWRFRNQNVWARQWDVTGEGTKIVNEGGTLWILGLRTEHAGTLIETLAGKTELLGCLCCTAATKAHDEPMLLVRDGELSATVGEWCPTGKAYELLVRVVRGGVGSATTELKRGGAGERGGGSVMTLFVGGK